MKSAIAATVCTLTVGVTLLGAGTARADLQLELFQSPSGNIRCQLYMFQPGVGSAGCEIRDYTWVAPPPPNRCEGKWGNSIGITQGAGAKLDCHSDTLFGGDSPVLPFGSTRTVAGITCASEFAGMTCTDTTTGHYFRLARDSYAIG